MQTNPIQKFGTDNEGRNFSVEILHKFNLISVNCHQFYKLEEFSMIYSQEGALTEIRHKTGWWIKF